MSEIKELRLTDLLSKIVDNRGKTCPTVETGFPLIATNCIKDEHLYPVFEKVRYVSESTYDNWFRGHPEPGDIIFVCKGSPGRVALTPDPVSFCIAQDMVALRADSEVVDSKYLYYVLQSRVIRNRIENMHVGTMIPHFKKGDFGKLLVPIHTDLAQQRAIAELLGALDDKIAANSRVVAHSDELSQAIFRSALTGNSQMLPLSSIADFVNGRAFTKNASGTGRVVIRIAEMNSGIGTSTVFNDIEVDEKHIARPGDILFAWSGSLTLQRWFRPEGIVNQHIFKVIARDRNPNWLVYELLREKLGYFKRVAANKATTMGHIQRKDLDELVPVPDDASQKHISEQMDALWNTMLNAEQESLQLADTRDALLPQLMSGKIRVRDAESVVEDVL